MRFDFTEIHDTDDFVNLEPGWYTVSVQEVREGQTREGDPRWGLLLRVAEGEFAGRFAAWDGIVWSERGAQRAKRVLDAFELDTRGAVELEPADLLAQKVDVQLVPEEYEHPVTGRRQRRNRIPYDGYAVAGSARGRGLSAEAEVGARVADRGQQVDGWGGEGESCSHEPGLDGSHPAPF
jgi:hypothetical protein